VDCLYSLLQVALVLVEELLQDPDEAEARRAAHGRFQRLAGLRVSVNMGRADGCTRAIVLRHMHSRAEHYETVIQSLESREKIWIHPLQDDADDDADVGSRLCSALFGSTFESNARKPKPNPKPKPKRISPDDDDDDAKRLQLGLAASLAVQQPQDDEDALIRRAIELSQQQQ
jgi:hypothetical protein